MEERLTQALVLIGLLLISGVIYTVNLPESSETTFARDAAEQDTAMFQEYNKATVERVEAEEEREFGDNTSLYQRLVVTIPGRGTATIEHTNLLDSGGSARFAAGDRVIVGSISQEGATEYVIVDRYRLPKLAIIVGAFIALALAFGRLRGLTALVGLCATGLVLLYFIAPQILAGKNPMLISFIGAGIIVLLSMFIAHGFRTRIRLAAASTLVTLAVSAALAWISVRMAALFGLGEADAFLLQSGYLGAIDMRGILLAGIVISVLGVLDDITTSQTAAVDELQSANPGLSWHELYGRGISIGREHIISLINTLILVYAGASLPLFLLFTVGSNQPVWVLLNSEYMAEEMVRALVGSMALIIAVPVSTAFAAWYLRKRIDPQPDEISGDKGAVVR